MKYKIIDTTNKRTYEFDSKEFRKKLGSFLVLYEIHKTADEKESIFARFELARQSNAIFLYECNGFKFMALPEISNI